MTGLRDRLITFSRSRAGVVASVVVVWLAAELLGRGAVVLFGRPALVTAASAQLVLAMAAVWIALARRDRLRTRVTKANGLLCPRCLYALGPSDQPAGVCPECGRAYAVDAAIEYWTKLGLLTYGRR